MRKNSMSAFWDLRLLPKCTVPANRDQIAAYLTHAFIYQIPQSRESKTYSLTVVCQAVQWPSTLVVVVQLPSCLWLSMTPRSGARQASLSFTVSQSLLKLMSIELVMASKHLVLCCPFSSCLNRYWPGTAMGGTFGGWGSGVHSKVLEKGSTQEWEMGTSLVAQWLRLWAAKAGGQGSIPGQWTGSHMLQLKTKFSKINKNKIF